MNNPQYSQLQSSFKTNSNEYNSDNQIDSMNKHNSSINNTIFQTSCSQDIKLDQYNENDHNSVCYNQQQHKDNLFYLSEGKSVPNFAECTLVPRSPSTNVQLDINDLKNRDQDVICSNDKLPFNDTSSNVSNVSAVSIPFPQDSNNYTQTKNNKQSDDSNYLQISEKTSNQQKQLRQNNKYNPPNSPPAGRKIPKIPDIFYSTKQNGTKKNDKLSYSWPKKRNQKLIYLIQGSQYRTTVATMNNKSNKKKEPNQIRK